MTPNLPASDPRAPGRAGAVALVFVAPLLASGLVSPLPGPLLAGAAVFLFLAIAHDVHRQRIPNGLTLAAFVAALGLGAESGGLDGAVAALLGAGAAFAILVPPYALGVIGAGDVKAAMVLGAAFGAGPVVALALGALVLGCAFAAVHAALREHADAVPPAATSGVPFAMAISLALAVLSVA